MILLDIKRVAAYVSVSPATIYRWRSDSAFVPPMLVGSYKHKRWDPKDADAWARAHNVSKRKTV
jgi:predicted DNA-binding transcriptional regulator AlpA